MDTEKAKRDAEIEKLKIYFANKHHKKMTNSAKDRLIELLLHERMFR